MLKDKRLFLYLALAFLGMMIWSKWSLEHAPKSTNEVAHSHVSSISDLPPASAFKSGSATGTADVPQILQKQEAPSHRTLGVKTDVLNVTIDKKGGNLVGASLPQYTKSITDNSPVEILNDAPDQLYIAQSGLMGKLGPDTRDGQATYQATQENYQLTNGQENLTVNLVWNKGGIKVTKSFVFYRGKYNFDIKYTVSNNSGKEWKGYNYSQIRNKKTIHKGMFGLNTYRGPAISSKDHPYQKVKYKEMDKRNLDQSSEGGWVSMQQRYFVSAWIPPQDQMNHYFSQKSAEDVYTIGYVGPEITVPSGQSKTTSSQFYVGPELQKELESLAPHLGLTIDYGWLWWASQPIFYVMSLIHSVVGNWGWSIVLVTLLIKLIFYPLSTTSYRSMAKMKKLQPRIEQIKQRFGDDKQKMNKAVMELYQKEKVNPLGGCLPMLVQIPIFIALYYVLIESVQLRQAPFMFWIKDLSVKDPYYVLPVLMGISMFVQQLINPPQMDKTQEMMMKFGLPIVFTVLFMNFPAGLTLYWFVNNVLSIAQQEYVMNKYSLKEKSGKKSISKKK